MLLFSQIIRINGGSCIGLTTIGHMAPSGKYLPYVRFPVVALLRKITGIALLHIFLGDYTR